MIFWLRRSSSESVFESTPCQNAPKSRAWNWNASDFKSIGKQFDCSLSCWMRKLSLLLNLISTLIFLRLLFYMVESSPIQQNWSLYATDFEFHNPANYRYSEIRTIFALNPNRVKILLIRKHNLTLNLSGIDPAIDFFRLCENAYDFSLKFNFKKK